MPKPPLTWPLSGRYPLMRYYIIGIAVVTVGVIVVVILNIATPLATVRAAVLQDAMGKALNSDLPLWAIIAMRFATLLIISYTPMVVAMRWILSPVHGVIKAIQSGQDPPVDQWDLAGRRLLNFPFLFVPVSIGMWILMPALFFHYSYLAGFMVHKTAVILSVRTSMVGLIASTIASIRIEDHSRRYFIPFFFPDGRLTEITGVARLSIKKRIRLVNRVGSVVPMTILVVTLLTLQWEVGNAAITAVQYGKGILIFAFVLMGYALLATAQLNWLVSRSITDPLRDITAVLKEVRRGHFKVKVPVISNDEIGYTAETINEMTNGLMERDRIRFSLELAREIQQSLLPKAAPQVDGLQVAAVSLYCDETGGDYYDFIDLRHRRPGLLGVVVGDVAGHGISSALLMATTRAFFRQRAVHPGSMDAVLTDVNGLLVRDVGDSGQFVTMSYVVIDRPEGTLRWVRAGHDPGLLFNPDSDIFVELKGPGIPLGVQADWNYETRQVDGFDTGHILVLATDGVWETRNPHGEDFGKERLEALVRLNARRPAQEILDAVIASHKAFRDGRKTDDDVTLVIVKAV